MCCTVLCQFMGERKEEGRMIFVIGGDRTYGTKNTVGPWTLNLIKNCIKLFGIIFARTSSAVRSIKFFQDMLHSDSLERTISYLHGKDAFSQSTLVACYASKHCHRIMFLIRDHTFLSHLSDNLIEE